MRAIEGRKQKKKIWVVTTFLVIFVLLLSVFGLVYYLKLSRSFEFSKCVDNGGVWYEGGKECYCDSPVEMKDCNAVVKAAREGKQK